MTHIHYKERIADRILTEKLSAKGAVLIRGPKWCGKTTTAEQQAKSIIYLNDPSHTRQYQEMAYINPTLLLEGDTPRLIDEWQITPQLWDAVRFEVDHRHRTGQFILTGSAVPVSKNHQDHNRHTGTGRFAIIDMLPMSLYESGDSTGHVSLSELFKSPENIQGHNHLTLPDMAFLTCRGGWPFAVTENLEPKAALSQAFDYVDLIVEEDISRVDDVQRNSTLARNIMRSYARYQGNQIPISMIRKDVAPNEHDKLTDDTVSSYLNALRHIFVIKDLEAWNPNLVSKSAIRTTPTRYYTDPSIATASLRLGPDDLLNSLSIFGFLFETLCVRDLRVYTQLLDGDLYHYRDSNGLECDTVIHLRNGQFGLIEIKLGGDKAIEEASKNLKKLKSLLDTPKMGEPAFMAIITAVGQYAYRRPDGIYVIPIGTLKP